jgi:hypothetical protein
VDERDGKLNDKADFMLAASKLQTARSEGPIDKSVTIGRYGRVQLKNSHGQRHSLILIRSSIQVVCL